MTQDQWIERFDMWLRVPTPENLLRANVFFDMRPLAGNLELAAPLRQFITEHAPKSQHFLRMLAENIMRFRPPLNWHGSVDTLEIEDVRTLDLKKHGTAVYVDAARFLALVHGVDEVNTRKRFEAVAGFLNVEVQRRDAWVSGFEFLQMMRLRIQVEESMTVPGLHGQPNVINYDQLDQIDRRILKECFRVGRRLQQRIETEYLR